MNYISIFTILTVVVAAYNFYILSRGNVKLSYVLQMIIYSGYCVVETLLALNSPDQKMLFLFVGLDIWAIIMAYLGLKRLRQLDSMDESPHLVGRGSS